MRDKELYARILGVEPPWTVTAVELAEAAGEVRVYLARVGAVALHCPECNQPAPGHDAKRCRWRGLDTCQLRTLLVADLPRVDCPVHGLRPIEVPWPRSARGSRP